jgi:hypothetical protein
MLQEIDLSRLDPLAHGISLEHAAALARGAALR